MLEFIPQVEELSKKVGGEKLAIDLLIFLGEQSYTGIEDGRLLQTPGISVPAHQMDQQMSLW
jgi:hypothetical protein